MANFTPKKLNQDTINGGNQFQEDSFFTPNDANSMVEGILNTQKEIDEMKANPPSSGGSEIIVDEQLSETSTNPAQNKVIKEALDGKLDKLPLDMTSSDTIVYTNDGNFTHKVAYPERNCTTYNIPMYYGVNAGKNIVAGYLMTNTPVNPYHTSNKKYSDELISSHIDEFHITQQWYEDLTIDDRGYDSGAFVSLAKLPNPTKIRIESFTIYDEYDPSFGVYLNRYTCETPQTFDITPDTNGCFSVTVTNAKLYVEWEYNEEFGEWMPSESQDPTQENVSFTLDFRFGYSDDQIYVDPSTGDFGLCSWIDCVQTGNIETEFGDEIENGYCTVSLYI